MAEERPYQPSARRLSEARKRGQVPVSQDLTRAVTLLGALLVLRLGGEGILQALEQCLRTAFTAAGGDEVKATLVLRQVGELGARALVPLLLVVLLAALATGFLQVGPLFAARAVAPSAGRIDPVSFFRRLLSEEGAYELLKICAKLAAVAAIAFYTLRGAARGLASLAERDVRTSLEIGAGLAFDLCIRIAAVFALLGVLDYFYQRYRHRQRLKMTRREYEREQRETEGHPLIRRERRWLRRRMAAGAEAGSEAQRGQSPAASRKPAGETAPRGPQAGPR